MQALGACLWDIGAARSRPREPFECLLVQRVIASGMTHVFRPDERKEAFRAHVPGPNCFCRECLTSHQEEEKLTVKSVLNSFEVILVLSTRSPVRPAMAYAHHAALLSPSETLRNSAITRVWPCPRVPLMLIPYPCRYNTVLHSSKEINISLHRKTPMRGPATNIEHPKRNPVWAGPRMPSPSHPQVPDQQTQKPTKRTPTNQKNFKKGKQIPHVACLQFPGMAITLVAMHNNDEDRADSLVLAQKQYVTAHTITPSMKDSSPVEHLPITNRAVRMNPKNSQQASKMMPSLTSA